MGSDPGPQIVIGVTGQRPETSDGQRRSEAEMHTRSEGSAEAQPATRSARPTLEMLAEPMLELVREAERLELVNEELRSAIETHDEIDTSSEPEAAPTELPGVATVTPMTVQLATIESVAHDESPTREVAFPTSDEMSIPPVGDLSVEPIADRFFSEGEVVAARVSAEAHEPEWADVVARESRKSLPEVVERRARLSKYVRWAVGGAAILCLAAVGRTLVAPATHASIPLSSVNSVEAFSAPVEPPAPKAAAAAVAVAPPPAPAELAVTETTAAVAEPASTAELAAAPADPARVEAPRVDVPKAEVPVAATTPSADDKANALKEKNDSRRLLERGKSADAIAAGERSVALDPTDGEAWLLLGAAYQDKGNMAEARRAYAACTKEGTRGPIGECRAMLR